MAGEILNTSALILPKCANAGAASALANEQGYLVYCETASKLGFVTSTGVSGELVTSA